MNSRREIIMDPKVEEEGNGQRLVASSPGFMRGRGEGIMSDSKGL